MSQLALVMLALVMLALFGQMERTYAVERAAHARWPSHRSTLRGEP